MEDKLKIAIIGMGPRGTSLLERVITYVEKIGKNNDIELFLFDKNNTFGSGCHNSELSEYLLVNTIAGQITMFFGEGMKDYGPIYEGKNFYEWHKENINSKTKKSDYLTRRDLGEYLKFFYSIQLGRMDKLKIRYHEIIENVVDIKEESNNVEVLTDKNKYLVDSCTLSMGHQEIKIKSDSIYDQLLNTKVISNICKNKKIALQGMGLSAFDIISECTEGLGGRFTTEADESLKYIPSGKEPIIYIYSKTGLPLSGKAYNSNSKFVYIPVYFNEPAIDKLKEKHNQLDFEEHVLPLIKKEVEYAYKMKSGKNDLDIEKFFKYEILNSESTKEYKEDFMNHLIEDIKQCNLGKFNSPIKFCQDIIRDLRNIVRYAVNEKGLTAKSYRQFIEKWHPIFTKICVGPPSIRLKQLEALIKANVCSIDFGKKPIVSCTNKITLKNGFKNENSSIEIDYLVKGRIPNINFHNSEDLLINNITQKYRLFKRNDFIHGGLEIDNKYRIISKDGTISKSLYALGLSTEGSNFFTLVLGRPHMFSSVFYDNNNVAIELIKKLNEKEVLYA